MADNPTEHLNMHYLLSFLIQVQNAAAFQGLSLVPLITRARGYKQKQNAHKILTQTNCDISQQ